MWKRKKKCMSEQEWAKLEKSSPLETGLHILVPPILAVATYVCTNIIASFPRVWQTSAGGCVLFLSAIISSIWSVRNEKKRDNKNLQICRGALQVTDGISVLLSPIFSLLESERSEGDLKIFLERVLESGITLFPHNGMRLSLYVLETVETDNDSEVESLRLVCHKGRTDSPRKEFSMQDSAGSAAIECAKGSTPRCVPKVVKDDPGVDRKTGAAWNSFMEIPLGSKDNRGALMIDSRREVPWSERDQSTATLLAHVLAQGLDITKSGALDTAPEVDEALRRLGNHSDENELD